MKAFLSLTAILEGITGLALILVPTFIVPLGFLIYYFLLKKELK